MGKPNYLQTIVINGVRYVVVNHSARNGLQLLLKKIRMAHSVRASMALSLGAMKKETATALRDGYLKRNIKTSHPPNKAN
jgi:hypothetical protein